MPTVSMPRTTDTRICVLHRNVPNVLANISGVVSANGLNIEKMSNQSRKDYAYTILDVSAKISDVIVSQIEALDGIIRVRVID